MTTQSPTVRMIDGRQIPFSGRWTIDPVHSEIQFVVRHMMIAKVRGRFREFSGAITIADQPQDSSVEATISAASLDTGDDTRDAHLRSADFLDVEHYPKLTFRSTSVGPDREDTWNVAGDLTIRDMTRPITMEVEFGGTVLDPWGNLRTGFRAATKIKRYDFGITWNQMMEAGGFMVGDEVNIDIDVEAVRQPDGG